MNSIIVIKNVEKLIKEIITQGFSYRTLAKTTGYSQTQISMILSGERNPSAKLANALCETLKIKFDDFFYINRLQKKSKSKKR